MSLPSVRPAAVSPPPGRHPLVATCAALGVIFGGGALLWGPAFRERLGLLDDARSSSSSPAAALEARSEPVRLAFLGADGRSLEEETREVALRQSTSAAARVIIEELRAGSRQGRGAVLPPAVRLRHVFVDKRGVAYVDMSPEVLRPSGAAKGMGAEAVASAEAETWHPAVRAAQAVAAALGMSLPEIAQVQLLVEGREVPVVTERVDLRRPLPASLPIRSSDTPR